MKKNALLFLLIFLTIFSVAASQDEAKKQPLVSIYDAAREEILSLLSDPAIEAKIENTDLKLTLPLCTHPLEKKSVQPNGVRTSVQVSCSDPVWSIYIPIILERWETVLYSARVLSRGQALSESDVISRRTNALALHQGYFRSYDEIRDLEVSRNLSTGQILTNAHLKPVIAIQKGQLVKIQVIANGLSVQSQGVAINNAYAGELVQVRNNRSGRIIEGIALKTGIVQIKL